MDPNECHITIRGLSAQILLYEGELDALDRAELEAAAVRLSEHIRALDEWIRKGGCLPRAWEVGENGAGRTMDTRAHG